MLPWRCISALVIFVWQILHNNPAMCTARASWCVAGSFHDGQSAAISCHFQPPLRGDRQPFTVVKHPLNPRHESTVNLVSCDWHRSALNCNASEGYSFNRDIGDVIVVKIRHVTRQHAGHYMCLPRGAADSSVDICTLSVIQNTTGNLSGSPRNTSRSSSRGHPISGQGSLQQLKDDSSQGYMAKVLVPLISVMLLVCLLLLAERVYRKFNLKRFTTLCRKDQSRKTRCSSISLSQSTRGTAMKKVTFGPNLQTQNRAQTTVRNEGSENVLACVNGFICSNASNGSQSELALSSNREHCVPLLNHQTNALVHVTESCDPEENRELVPKQNGQLRFVDQTFV